MKSLFLEPVSDMIKTNGPDWIFTWSSRKTLGNIDE